jgi:hypothetical protein
MRDRFQDSMRHRLVYVGMLVVVALMASAVAGAQTVRALKRSGAVTPNRAQSPPRLMQNGDPGTMASPIGTLNDVMRGILFPNSNLIFNVQVEDPGADRPTPKDPGSTFSVTAWGDSLYPPWAIVSYAAVALAESSTLLMNPRRRCDNGKPVPTSRPDWLRYTKGLADTAEALHKASEARDRAAVIVLTERLSEACANCHSAYRRGSGPARCTARE